MLQNGIGLSLIWLDGAAGQLQRPNIVFILADDMGFNDVSYHGSDQIQTPNIDTLAYEGVVLQQYYSEPICTPTRTALLTGKYPERFGMQSTPLTNSEDRAIPVSQILLPSYLKNLGYSTHLVGKWHVGMSRNEYLPLKRGFDSHYGIRGGFVDYYTHNKVEQWPVDTVFAGLDMWEGTFPVENNSEFLTDTLTDRALHIIHTHNKTRPFFIMLAHGAPHAGNDDSLLDRAPNVTPRNSHIAFSDRRRYADIVSNLDDNIGRVIEALAAEGILHDTIIVFASDNGAPTTGEHMNTGSNLPFRGIKQTPWEGAVRVPAIIWHGSLGQPRGWSGLMHITDWLPTLISAAGGQVPAGLDGADQWKPIIQNKRSRRNELLIMIDDLKGFAAYRLGPYKMIIGDLNDTAAYSGYVGEQQMALRSNPPSYLQTLASCQALRAFESIGNYLNLNEIDNIRENYTVRQLDNVKDATLCTPNGEKGCLFNVVADPMESHDIWEDTSRIVAVILARMRNMWGITKQRYPSVNDLRAEPALTRYIWQPWLRDGLAEIPQFSSRDGASIDSNVTSSTSDYETGTTLRTILESTTTTLSPISA